MKSSFLTAVAALTFWASPAVSQEIGYPDLVSRLINPAHLATLPSKGNTSHQWSSYDRESRYDASSGKYVHWDANRDGDGYIRKEGEQVVMAEMKGPGVLWRIWSAQVDQGSVKIIIDGKTAVDMPFADYFDGKHKPFNYPALSYQTVITPGHFASNNNLGGGRNLYIPIPYQKSCKIVADPNYGKYFQFDYETFPEGTQVPSFTGEYPPAAAKAIGKVDAFLSKHLGENPVADREGQQTTKKAVTAEPGETAEVAKLTGPAAITAIRVHVALTDREEQVAALRQLALRITWDGQDSPAVWSPLGDFFGSAPGINKYRTLLSGMTDDGFYAYWYMPFGKNALVELTNDGDKAREVSFEITHAPLPDGFDGMGYFHAKWHRNLDPVSKDRWPDWEVLRTTGRGRFCGMALDVWTPRPGGAPQEVAGPGFFWWGEGDEKFFVDGEKFPSWFGTGTEDYFGYAWGDPALFSRPFHAQTLSENNAGHQSLVRYQFVDSVPFQRSFEAYMEKYFPDDYPARYAAVAYWYLSPDGEDPLGPVPMDQRLGYYYRPPIEAGGYRVLGEIKGSVSTQMMGGFAGGHWANNDQLWWTLAGPGDRLNLQTSVPHNGMYQLRMTFTRSFDYGTVQVYLDGKKVGDRIDLYSPDVSKSEPVDLGTHQLEKGKHRLTVEIVGTNPLSKQFSVGIDQIQFQPRSR